MMRVPNIGLEFAANMIPLISLSLLIGCGIYLEDVATTLPSAGTFKIIMLDGNVDTMYLEKQEMKGVPLTLLANKGNGHGKQGSASFLTCSVDQ